MFCRSEARGDGPGFGRDPGRFNPKGLDDLLAAGGCMQPIAATLFPIWTLVQGPPKKCPACAGQVSLLGRMFETVAVILCADQGPLQIDGMSDCEMVAELQSQTIGEPGAVCI